MTTDEYFDRCAGLDWFACMSDDYSKLAKARVELRHLREVAKGEPDLEAILDAFVLWRDESFENGKATTRPQRANWVPAEASPQTTIFDMGA